MSEGRRKLKLTKTAKNRYIARASGECPYCHSEDITGHSIEVDGSGASQEITCVCGRSWYDIYRLVDIEEAE